MNRIKETSWHGVAFGLASILVAGGTLILPSAAVADQACGNAGTTYTGAVLDIDDRVALRKNAMYRAWVLGR